MKRREALAIVSAMVATLMTTLRAEGDTVVRTANEKNLLQVRSQEDGSVHVRLDLSMITDFEVVLNGKVKKINRDLLFKTL